MENDLNILSNGVESDDKGLFSDTELVPRPTPIQEKTYFNPDIKDPLERAVTRRMDEVVQESKQADYDAFVKRASIREAEAKKSFEAGQDGDDAHMSSQFGFDEVQRIKSESPHAYNRMMASDSFFDAIENLTKEVGVLERTADYAGDFAKSGLLGGADIIRSLIRNKQMQGETAREWESNFLKQSHKLGEDWRKDIEEDAYGNPRNIYNPINWPIDVASQGFNITGAMLFGSVGQAVGVTVGGSVGTLGAPDPTDVGTVPAGAIGGALVGRATGTFAWSYFLEKGLLADELILAREARGEEVVMSEIDDISTVGGLINGLAETAGMLTFQKLIPKAIKDKIFKLPKLGKSHADGISKILGNPMAVARIGSAFKAYMVNLGTETSTEAFQEFVNVVASEFDETKSEDETTQLVGEILNHMSGGATNFIGLTDAEQGASEELSRILHAGFLGFKTSAIIGLGGFASSKNESFEEARRKAMENNQNHITSSVNGHSILSDLVNEVNALAPAVRNSPEELETFIDDLLAKSEFEEVHLDAKGVLEFLKKLEEAIDSQESGAPKPVTKKVTQNSETQQVDNFENDEARAKLISDLLGESDSDQARNMPNDEQLRQDWIESHIGSPAEAQQEDNFENDEDRAKLIDDLLGGPIDEATEKVPSAEQLRKEWLESHTGPVVEKGQNPEGEALLQDANASSVDAQSPESAENTQNSAESSDIDETPTVGTYGDGDTTDQQVYRAVLDVVGVDMETLRGMAERGESIPVRTSNYLAKIAIHKVTSDQLIKHLKVNQDHSTPDNLDGFKREQELLRDIQSGKTHAETEEEIRSNNLYKQVFREMELVNDLTDKPLTDEQVAINATAMTAMITSYAINYNISLQEAIDRTLPRFVASAPTKDDYGRQQELKDAYNTIDLGVSVVTKDLPALQELSNRAVEGDVTAQAILEQEARKSLGVLSSLIAGVRIDFKNATGIFDNEVEVSWVVTIDYPKVNEAKLMAGLARFGANYHQFEIHRLEKTEAGTALFHRYEDKSYNTIEHELSFDGHMSPKLMNKYIQDAGLYGMTMTKDENGRNTLTGYFVAQNYETEQEYKDDYNGYIENTNALIASLERPTKSGARRSVEVRRNTRRLYRLGRAGSGAPIEYSELINEEYETELRESALNNGIANPDIQYLNEVTFGERGDEDSTVPPQFQSVNPVDAKYVDPDLPKKPPSVGELGALSRIDEAMGQGPAGTMDARNPTGVNSKEARGGENPLLLSDYEATLQSSAIIKKNATAIRNYPHLDIPEGATNQEVLELFIQFGVNNLNYMYDQIPQWVRDRSKLWYDGANLISRDWAQAYNLSPAQVAGIIAVMSPQNPWYQNASVAERVIRIMNENQDTEWSPQMTKQVKVIVNKMKKKGKHTKSSRKFLKLVKYVDERKLSQLQDDAFGDVLRAVWIRVYDEAHNDRSFRKITPEGAFIDVMVKADGTPQKAGWGSWLEISKAVSIYQDGSQMNINRRLGIKHKVRNFYNNIYNPNSADGFATIDTHAMAGALFTPYASEGLPVKHGFGTSNKGTPNAGTTNQIGVYGTYGLYYEMYRRVAEKHDILNREAQSIIWESVRGLFSDDYKSIKETQKDGEVSTASTQAEATWKQHQEGNLTYEQARQQIEDRAGGFQLPDWTVEGSEESSRPDTTEPSGNGRTSYGEGLHGARELGEQGAGLFQPPRRPRDSVRVPDRQQVEGTFFQDVKPKKVPSIPQSKLLKSLASKRVPASATPRQWRQFFDSEGITPEEIAWTNLDYFLGLAEAGRPSEPKLRTIAGLDKPVKYLHPKFKSKPAQARADVAEEASIARLNKFLRGNPKAQDPRVPLEFEDDSTIEDVFADEIQISAEEIQVYAESNQPLIRKYGESSDNPNIVKDIEFDYNNHEADFDNSITQAILEDIEYLYNNDWDASGESEAENNFIEDVLSEEYYEEEYQKVIEEEEALGPFLHGFVKDEEQEAFIKAKAKERADARLEDAYEVEEDRIAEHVKEEREFHLTDILNMVTDELNGEILSDGADAYNDGHQTFIASYTDYISGEPKWEVYTSDGYSVEQYNVSMSEEGAYALAREASVFDSASLETDDQKFIGYAQGKAEVAKDKNYRENKYIFEGAPEGYAFIEENHFSNDNEKNIVSHTLTTDREFAIEQEQEQSKIDPSVTEQEDYDRFIHFLASNDIDIPEHPRRARFWANRVHRWYTDLKNHKSNLPIEFKNPEAMASKLYDVGIHLTELRREDEKNNAKEATEVERFFDADDQKYSGVDIAKMFVDRFGKVENSTGVFDKDSIPTLTAHTIEESQSDLHQRVRDLGIRVYDKEEAQRVYEYHKSKADYSEYYALQKIEEARYIGGIEDAIQNMDPELLPQEFKDGGMHEDYTLQSLPNIGSLNVMDVLNKRIPEDDRARAEFLDFISEHAQHLYETDDEKSKTEKLRMDYDDILNTSVDDEAITSVKVALIENRNNLYEKYKSVALDILNYDIPLHLNSVKHKSKGVIISEHHIDLSGIKGEDLIKSVIRNFSEISTPIKFSIRDSVDSLNLNLDSSRQHSHLSRRSINVSAKSSTDNLALRLMGRTQFGTDSMMGHTHPEVVARMEESRDKVEQYHKREVEFPFAGKWHEANLRFELITAVNEGKDALAWATGEVIVNKYEQLLKKDLNALDWERTSKGYSLTPVDTKNVKQSPTHISKNELKAYVGSGMAETIRKSESDKGTLEGDDLYIASEFMIQLYDVKMGKYLKSLKDNNGKSFGQKIERRKDVDGYEWNFMIIPESMRDWIRDENLPLFQPADDSAEGSSEGDGLSGERKALESNPNAYRGYFDFNKYEIGLTTLSNPTTFIHEATHAHLFNLINQAKAGHAGAKADLDATLKWLGVESVNDILIRKTDSAEVKAQKTEYHEKFANGVIVYLGEGKAPSVGLQKVFDNFRMWVVKYYEKLVNDGLELSEEIREVYGNMLFADAEISVARESLLAKPLARDALQMDQKEYSDYLAKMDQAVKDARKSLDRQIINKANRAKQSRFKKLRTTKKKRITAEVEREQVYVARKAMHGNGEDKTKLTGDSVKAVTEGQAERDAIRKASTKLINNKGRGQNVEAVAEQFDYSSGYEMLKDMANAPKLKDEVERRLDIEMEQALKEDDSIAEINDGETPEAVDALNNSSLENAIIAEMVALQKITGRKQGFAVSDIKRRAKALINEMVIKDINPDSYILAERTASNNQLKALEKGDHDTALNEAKRRLYNQYMYREARDRTKGVKTRLSRLKALQSKNGLKKVDQTYKEHISSILSRFRFTLKPKKGDLVLSGVETREFMKEQLAEGAPVRIDEDNVIYNNPVHWGNLTMQEFDELYVALMNLKKLGESVSTVTLYGVTQDQPSISARLAELLVENIKPKKKTLGNKQSKLIEYLSSYWVELRKRGAIANKWDNFDEAGYAQEILIGSVNDAQGRQEKRLALEYEVLRQHFKKYNLDSFLTLNKKTKITEDLSLTKEEILAVGLNYGNEYNKERIIESIASKMLSGSNVASRDEAEAMVGKIINALSDTDWQFIQETWNYFDTFWDEVYDLELRTTGVAPKRVEAEAFTTPTGRELRGGYYPVSYDPNETTSARQDRIREEALQVMSGFNSSAMTAQGHNKERVGSGGRVVVLDITPVFAHVSQVVHDLTHRETLVGIHKIIKDPVLKTEMEGRLGIKDSQEWDRWLQRTAIGDEMARNTTEKIFGFFRSKVTVMGLGMNFATSGLQLMGLTQSAVVIGNRWVASGLTDYLVSGNIFEFRKVIDEKSSLMAGRKTSFTRDVRELENQLRKSRSLTFYERALFAPIVMMQSVVDSITWSGAYNKAIYHGDTETSAIRRADKAVVDSQGSGRISDLASIEAGGPLTKMFTTFYSFMNTLLNVSANEFNKAIMADTNLAQKALRITYSALMLYFIPTTITAYVLDIMLAGDEPETPEEWAEWLVQNNLSYLAGQFPLFREFAPSEFRYTGPAGLRFATAIQDGLLSLKKALPAGEPFGGGDVSFFEEPIEFMNTKDFRDLIDGTGAFFPLPSTSIKRALHGAQRIEEGATEGPLDATTGLFFRKKKE